MKCNDNEQWNKPNVKKIIPKYTEEDFGRKFRMNTRTFANILLIFFLRKTNIALQKTVINFIGYLTTEMTVQTNADQFGKL